MLEEYIQRGAQRLRCGYTTGSCAAGAAKAAALMLLSGRGVSSVELMTPKGIMLSLEILNTVITSEYAFCAVRKDSGDDPDITNGILVYAKVKLCMRAVVIRGGKGIGTVTKKGLDQPVGAAAINSVPRKMIEAAVMEAAELYGYSGGFDVEISVPDGERIAQKTYNPRMGIVGGISIIGTSGIVEPMSNAALIETIRTEESMIHAEGKRNLLLTIGNYSGGFVERHMPFAFEKSVKCSNFIGEAIELALGFGFESILIIGHIGKLVKLGAGIMNTHSAQADGRMDVLISCGAAAGIDSKTLADIYSCATVDAALEILGKTGKLEELLGILSVRAQYYLDAKVKSTVKIGAVMFSDKSDIILKTPACFEIVKLITEEYNG